ncbi:MAG: glutamine synthetase III [Proteobacteria bacterium]|nr:glutamine synthetase III [Pseudomonadota bacterium]
MSTGFRAYARYQALATASQRSVPKNKARQNSTVNSELFGCHTFNYTQMAKMLPASDVKLLKNHPVSGKVITQEVAHRVALAVKQWAVEKGATHYTHWFQPQTESTAEKHDAFLDFNDEGLPIEKLNGKLLICQEPDASSFPSGGQRTTFEARGYTIWDASSFMFLNETKYGKTLTIPSLFISYNGEPLDNKTPLLRSIRALNKQAMVALDLLGEPTSYVQVNCGPEQEFFVIDSALYHLRPDLQLAGKTVLGAPSHKGQQLDDHYFGTINTRVINMMMEVEAELITLGVPVKTRHNEVAPSQYEMAPIYEGANMATDHNRLLMAVLKKVSRRHNLTVLFHEKPFNGLNGSGKHLNWSLSSSQGVNLLDPGDSLEENLRFLYFLTASLRAVHDHGDLLRAAVAVPGNDFRMGANEAPPGIMSVFLGHTLSKVVNDLVDGAKEKSINHFGAQDTINLDIVKIPSINKDNTDRNRTSPFAFTGNKFEFRALGSSQSISTPITYLNTGVTASLEKMNGELKALLDQGKSLQGSLLAVIVQNLSKSKAIHFDGDSYSDEWKKEAENRNLPHLKTTPQALAKIIEPNNMALFKKYGIMGSDEEILARQSIAMERYVMLRMIELKSAHELLTTYVFPAASEYLKQLASAVNKTTQAIGSVPNAQKDYLLRYSELTGELATKMTALAKTIEQISELEESGNLVKTANYIVEYGMTAHDEAREVADKLETMIDDSLWPLPRYRELLFVN